LKEIDVLRHDLMQKIHSNPSPTQSLAIAPENGQNGHKYKNNNANNDSAICNLTLNSNCLSGEGNGDGAGTTRSPEVPSKVAVSPAAREDAKRPQFDDQTLRMQSDHSSNGTNIKFNFNSKNNNNNHADEDDKRSKPSAVIVPRLLLPSRQPPDYSL